MSYLTPAHRYDTWYFPPKNDDPNNELDKNGRHHGSYATDRLTNSPSGHPMPERSLHSRLPRPSPAFNYGFGGHGAFGGGDWRPQFGYGGYEQTGYRDYSFGQQYPGWRQQAKHSYQALPSATAAGQEYREGYYGQGQQQYVPFPYQPQPYQPYVPYGYQQFQPWLMQQWQAVNDAPPPSQPFSPPLPPTSGSATNAPAFRPQQALKSVTAADLNRRFRIDKESRYGQTTLKPNSSNLGFFDANVPPPPESYSNYYTTPQPNHSAMNNHPAVGSWRGGKTGKRTANAQTQQPAQPVVPGLRTGLYEGALRSFPQTQEEVKLRILERPVPSLTYMTQAKQSPRTMDINRPLLVVLDLNGTILYRKKRANFIARPRMNEFLRYLLKNHKVMIWSSAMPDNVDSMCKEILTKPEYEGLVAIWARDKLRLLPHAYNSNVQVYKQLSWIWENKSIQSSHPDPTSVWSQENTVLIDDSMEKAASEPHNLIQLEEFKGREKQREVDVLGQIVSYLETLRSQRDVSAYVRLEPFKYKPKETFDWTSIFNEMH